MAETWQQHTAQEFKTIVDAAVIPVYRERERGIYSHFTAGESARIRTSLLGFALDYFTFDLTKQHGITGLNGLHFLPSHGVDVIRHRQLGGQRPARGTFGLREDDSIVRAYSESADGMFAPFLPERELTKDESDTLIDLMHSPQLYAASVDDVLSLNPEEYEKIESARQRSIEVREQYLSEVKKHERHIVEEEGPENEEEALFARFLNRRRYRH